MHQSTEHSAYAVVLILLHLVCATLFYTPGLVAILILKYPVVDDGEAENLVIHQTIHIGLSALHKMIKGPFVPIRLPNIL